tara:strand:+ start:82 stop:192 length:111 start_codon:yes stop_codon:yes gene_type:complete
MLAFIFFAYEEVTSSASDLKKHDAGVIKKKKGRSHV